MNLLENEKISYQVSGTDSYLVIETQEKIRKYQLKMIENNTIEGLLPLHNQSINGIYLLNYNITGKSRLSDCFNRNMFAINDVKKILQRLIQNLLSLEEYFLLISQVVLNPDYIFVDGMAKIYYLYLPFEEWEDTSCETSIKEFYLSLLGTYFVSETDSYFTDLIKILIQPSFDLEHFIALLSKNEEKPVKKQEMFANITQSSTFKNNRAGINEKIPIIKENAAMIKDKIEKDNIGKNKIKKEKTAKETIQKDRPEIEIPRLKLPSEMQESEKKEEKKREKKGILGGLFTRNTENKEGKSEKRKKKKETDLKETRIESLENQGSNSEKWNMTELVSTLEGTVILGQDKNPYLKYKNEIIVLNHFPFLLGKTAKDYTIHSNVVSRTHATIIKREDEYFIKDENSKNYTYLNGVRLPPYSEYKLNSGDKICLANEEMIFEINGR